MAALSGVAVAKVCRLVELVIFSQVTKFYLFHKHCVLDN
jgi:hypothetical protein